MIFNDVQVFGMSLKIHIIVSNWKESYDVVICEIIIKIAYIF